MLSLPRATLAASALIPAILLGTTGPAVAATNTLSITAVNRSGAKVAVTATVVSLATSQEYRVRTGTKRKLPKGNYAVLASIGSLNTSTTLGGKTVKVSGASKLTIDARHGKLVRLGLSPAVSGLESTVDAEICSNTGGGADSEVQSWGDATRPLYVIPTASKKIAFAAMGTWTDRSGSTDAYATLYRTTGVPSTPSRTFARSKLATMTVDSRRGPAGTNYSDVAVQPTHQGCGSYLYGSLANTDRPTTTKIHLSPGRWDIRGDLSAGAKNGQTWAIGGYTTTRTVAAGKSYFVRYFGAAWGPGFHVPMTYQGRISYPLDDMFTDPAFSGLNGNYGGAAGDKSKATLKFGGKVVKTAYDKGFGQDGPSLEYKVKKAGWYTLTNSAQRYYPEITFPKGMLSTASTVTYRFHAKPNTSVLSPVSAVQQVPAGLNGYNHAKAGSSTNVALRINRHLLWGDVKKGAAPKLKSLTTKASFDGGKTWKTAPVKKIGGVWTAVVKNPGSGAVSLRTRATYTNTGYTEVTVYRAYGIG
ncbi:hypothetical protein [Actinoplanes couchii]|nr:hypothetical protein [Actinoplanes couchii]MDR6324665.1 hypothetical protein [Actinoplanes couchii]